MSQSVCFQKHVKNMMLTTGDYSLVIWKHWNALHFDTHIQICVLICSHAHCAYFYFYFQIVPIFFIHTYYNLWIPAPMGTMSQICTLSRKSEGVARPGPASLFIRSNGNFTLRASALGNQYKTYFRSLTILKNMTSSTWTKKIKKMCMFLQHKSKTQKKKYFNAATNKTSLRQF